MTESSSKSYYSKEARKLGGEEYLNFINSVRSPATKQEYGYCIMQYMRFLQVSSPSDLMFNSEPKVIESHLRDYMVYLRDRISYATRMVYCSAAFTFYSMNDITLNKKKLYRYLGEQTRAHKDRAYTTEEIAKILQSCDLRLKAIVLLMASSGIRVGALPLMKLAHLLPVSDYDLYRITIYENAKEEYYTFCTPEAKRAIDEYLAYRERSGERITPSSPLFREQFDLNDPFQISARRQLRATTLQTTFDRILIKAGLRTMEHETETTKIRGRVRKDVSRFNGFRKFFNTNLVRAKVNPQIKEMLMGHSIDLDDNYYKPTADERLQEYLKAVNLLTINEENRLRMELSDVRLRLDRLTRSRKICVN
jgi:integrase